MLKTHSKMDDKILVEKFNQDYELAICDSDLALSSIGEINGNSSDSQKYFKEGVIESEKEKFYSRLKDRQKDNQKDLGIDKD